VLGGQRLNAERECGQRMRSQGITVLACSLSRDHWLTRDHLLTRTRTRTHASTMTMQAVLVHDGAVSIGEAPMPTIAAGEVLVRVRATALNRADLLQRAGSYPPPPGESEILGLELAGEVAQVVEGDTSHSLRVGERVCALVGGGGYAQYARVAASSVIRVPEWMSVEQAAALPEAWMTAYQALHWVGGLARLPTKNVLIHAGASGVGLAAIQLAKLQPGVRVLVTAGSQVRRARCS